MILLFFLVYVYHLQCIYNFQVIVFLGMLSIEQTRNCKKKTEKTNKHEKLYILCRDRCYDS